MYKSGIVPRKEKPLNSAEKRRNAFNTKYCFKNIYIHKSSITLCMISIDISLREVYLLVEGRGSRVTSRGSENSSQLFFSVVKRKFHLSPCLLEFPVPVLLSDKSVNKPARLLPFADE